MLMSTAKDESAAAIQLETHMASFLHINIHTIYEFI